MPTKLSICNDVANLLGKDLFTDPDTDSNPFAERIRSTYDNTLKELLAEHHWSFATREATLLSATIPVPEFTEYALYYELPSDYVSIVQYGSDGDNRLHPAAYRIESNYLLSNDTTVQIKYVSNINPPEVFPAYFAELLSLKLAYKLSYALVSNMSLRDEIYTLYNNKLTQAIGRDQREDKSRQYDDDLYNRVRSSRYYFDSDYVGLN